MHGIDFKDFQHHLPVIALLVMGIFHLLNVLLKQASEFAMKMLRAIRAVARSLRLTKVELQRATEKTRAAKTRRGRRPRVQSCPTIPSEGEHNVVAK
jgi:hypothetical protein